jgi:DNA gyrase subunit A
LAKCESEDAARSILADVPIALDVATVLKYAQGEEFILTVTENGYGKITSAYEYRVTNRGGQGIINIITSSRNGSVVTSFPVEDEHHIMIITNQGRLIRCRVDDIRVISRNTQGVVLCGSCTDRKDTIVSVAPISDASDEESLDEEVSEDTTVYQESKHEE